MFVPDLGSTLCKACPFCVTAARQKMFSTSDGTARWSKCQVWGCFNVYSPHFLPFSFWRVASVTALLHGAGKKLSILAQVCKLQLQQGKETPWEKVGRRQPWVVLLMCLSHTDGACRVSGPACPACPQTASIWSSCVLSSFLGSSGKAGLLHLAMQ